MTTETTTLHIRRATPLDAVNLYRLLVDEEKRAGTPDDPEQAARIAHILQVIDSGYASAAVVSGRIVGSIGAHLNEDAVVGAWLALSPSFYDTQLGTQLVAGLVRYAQKQRLPLQFRLLLPSRPHIQRAFEEAGGFLAAAVIYERAHKSDEQKQDAGDRGGQPSFLRAGDEVSDAELGSDTGP